MSLRGKSNRPEHGRSRWARTGPMPPKRGVRRWLPARSGENIATIGPLGGRRGLPPLGGYCATKFAVVGLTEALRVELYGGGITASLIMPGVIDTPMVRESSTKKAGLPDNIIAMPPQWVTWAVIAAVMPGLAAGDVP